MESAEQRAIRTVADKESKTEEQAFKSFGSSGNIEDKFSSLLKKFTGLEKENRKLNSALKQHEKRYEILLREKDNLQKEYNKGVLMRDKLEQVCREQQKLIKAVKNESLSKIREEEERRKENQAKFQHSINEINTTLNKNSQENIKLKEDNIKMTEKLMFLAEQYQAREKQLEKMNEKNNLESQLNDAKLTKVKMEATIEKEILLKEKKNTMDELLHCKSSIQKLQDREKLLKEELALYSSKHADFQSSLQKSNDVFITYKNEIEKMCKSTKKLEKESLEWKRKWEKSNISVIELATAKQASDNYNSKATRQLQQLQKLLRAMQSERTILYQALKDNNIERPPLPALPQAPEPVVLPSVPPKADRMDLMVKNCAELKQTLAKLQNQMTDLTIKQSSVSDESKKNKNKKSKGKQKVCPTKDKQQAQSYVMQNVPATSETSDFLDANEFIKIQNNQEEKKSLLCTININNNISAEESYNGDITQSGATTPCSNKLDEVYADSNENLQDLEISSNCNQEMNESIFGAAYDNETETINQHCPSESQCNDFQ